MVKDYKSDEVEVEKGATVFCIGGLKPDGTYQGVVNGRAGSIPESVLVPITPELLESLFLGRFFCFL